MTVTTTTNSIDYTADGVQLIFPAPFKFFVNTDLQVSTINDGIPTTKVLNTDYTVSGAGSELGGDVTFLVAPTALLTVRIRRQVEIVQESDYVDGSALPAATLENNLDLLTMGLQQVDEKASGGAGATTLQVDPDNLNLWAGNGLILNNLGDAVEAQDATTLHQVQDLIIASGSLPTPTTPGQDGYMLIAAAGQFIVAAPATVRSGLGLGTLAVQAITDLPDNSTIVVSGGKLAVSSSAPPRNYVDGTVSTASTTSYTVSANFECADSTGARMMRLGGSSLTKGSLTTATGWTAGAAGVCRPSGVVSFASSDSLHVFLIAKADGTTDSGIDTSLTATNLLADATGYTYYRRIATLPAGSSTTFMQVTNTGDHFMFNGGTSSATSSGTIGTSAADKIFSRIPTGVVVWPIFTAIISGAAARTVVFYPKSATYSGTPGTNADGMITSVGAGIASAVISCIPTDTAATIQVKASGASTNLALTTWGWIDRRGKS